MKEKDRKMKEVKLLKECKSVLVELVDAAKPFTSGDVVDELMSTIPLMDKLDIAIKKAELLIEDEKK